MAIRNIYWKAGQDLHVWNGKTLLFRYPPTVPPPPPYVEGIFVSMNGLEANPGTIDLPTTLRKAITLGKNILIRGGIYTNHYTDSWYQYRLNGLSNITIQNYNNESVLFDYTGKDFGTASKVIIQLNKCSNVIIKGIKIANCKQAWQSPVIGFNVCNSNNITFDNCSASYIGGQGFKICDEAWGTFDRNTEVSYNLKYINCDSFCNEDKTSPTPYDGADGMGCNWNSENQGDWVHDISFINCRSYYNSDDGFDFFASNVTCLIDNCWSFCNGKHYPTNENTGNGMGFKLGPSRTDRSNAIQFTVNNCISAFNSGHGFDQNSMKYTSIHKFNNNIAYNNSGVGFMFFYSKWHPVINSVDEFTNNISQANQENADINPNCIQNGNSWQTGIFHDLSYITIEKLMAQRDINGNLPKLN